MTQLYIVNGKFKFDIRPPQTTHPSPLIPRQSNKFQNWQYALSYMICESILKVRWGMSD